MTEKTKKELVKKLAKLPKEELEKAFDLFVEIDYNYTDDIYTYALNKEILTHLIEKFNFQAEELMEFFHPYNIAEFEDEHDELLELI